MWAFSLLGSFFERGDPALLSGGVVFLPRLVNLAPACAGIDLERIVAIQKDEGDGRRGVCSGWPNRCRSALRGAQPCARGAYKQPFPALGSASLGNRPAPCRYKLYKICLKIESDHIASRIEFHDISFILSENW